MPSITSLALTGVLRNGTATNVTFTPVAPQNGSAPAEWRDMTKTAYNLQPSISGSILRNQGRSPARKIRSTILIPVIQVVDGKDVVVAVNRVDIEARISDFSTENDRKELTSTAQEVVTSGMFSGMTNNLVAWF